MQNKKILLVDDDAILRRSLSRILELENFSVTTAASGEEAVSLLKDNEFDLVATDLVMPGFDGIQVLKEVKGKDPFVSVVILTGYGDMTTAIEALRLGADDYLLKPCEPDEIILRIYRCLEKQEAFQKIRFYENILPVCLYCKSIRDDNLVSPGQGKWLRMEEYLNIKSGTNVSHSCCPQCRDRAAKDMGLDE